jgi:uncharacterized protein YndB with AHSA1/START domain
MNDIVRSIEIQSDIDRVWSFLTTPDKIAQWLMPNTFVPRVGSEFTMDCPPGIGSGAPVACKVKEFRRPENGRARLVYSWVIDQPLTETLLEIDLTELAGATRLDLVHSGWAEGESELRSRHDMGWDFILGTRLVAALAGPL